MRKATTITLIVLALFLATSAVAWGAFIFQDPVFEINGREVNVWVGFDDELGIANSDIQVTMMVPRTLEAEIKDPCGMDVEIVYTAPQRGQLRVSRVVVLVPLTDTGESFDVTILVEDEDGFFVERSGKAGRPIVVPYRQWQ